MLATSNLILLFAIVFASSSFPLCFRDIGSSKWQLRRLQYNTRFKRSAILMAKGIGNSAAARQLDVVASLISSFLLNELNVRPPIGNLAAQLQTLSYFFKFCVRATTRSMETFGWAHSSKFFSLEPPLTNSRCHHI
uniref:Putative secreted protein n=1 Tax=Rhipicephalus microplus TaxID=6941 RepID=A0A6G5A202_RHIMP